jgi:hypothetical protein
VRPVLLLDLDTLDGFKLVFFVSNISARWAFSSEQKRDVFGIGVVGGADGHAGAEGGGGGVKSE